MWPPQNNCKQIITPLSVQLYKTFCPRTTDVHIKGG
jgi:hypothetical protein